LVRPYFAFISHMKFLFEPEIRACLLRGHFSTIQLPRITHLYDICLLFDWGFNYNLESTTHTVHCFTNTVAPLPISFFLRPFTLRPFRVVGSSPLPITSPQLPFQPTPCSIWRLILPPLYILPLWHTNTRQSQQLQPECLPLNCSYSKYDKGLSTLARQ
jgi:hypothetical protein